MKTRADEIREAADLEFPISLYTNMQRIAFEVGAEWADQNPPEQKHECLFLNELHKVREQMQALEKEVERLSAELTIPDEDVEIGIEKYGEKTDSLNGYRLVGMAPGFRRGVRWALEFLNAQRGVKP